MDFFIFFVHTRKGRFTFNLTPSAQNKIFRSLKAYSVLNEGQLLKETVKFNFTELDFCFNIRFSTSSPKKITIGG